MGSSVPRRDCWYEMQTSARGALTTSGPVLLKSRARTGSYPSDCTRYFSWGRLARNGESLPEPSVRAPSPFSASNRNGAGVDIGLLHHPSRSGAWPSTDDARFFAAATVSFRSPLRISPASNAGGADNVSLRATAALRR